MRLAHIPDILSRHARRLGKIGVLLNPHLDVNHKTRVAIPGKIWLNVK